jgi:hypothetical protein
MIAGQVGNAGFKRRGVSGMSGPEARPIAVPGANADQAGSDDGSVRLRRAGKNGTSGWAPS